MNSSGKTHSHDATPAAPVGSVVIATRESRLALWQAEHVKALLKQRFGLQVSLLGMTTQGDQILDRALSKVGGKGLFVKELETALQERRADLAVHSLKDVPMDLPSGFSLAAVMEREDPRDAFVSPRHENLQSLPLGACVGTSSLRRVVMLRALRPDLRIEPLRGNLDTRLRKLDEGQYDAIVLAAAGLKRLGLSSRIRAVFDTQDMLPAAGQGALGLEIREGDAPWRPCCSSLCIPQPGWRYTPSARYRVPWVEAAACPWPRTGAGRGMNLNSAPRWGTRVIPRRPCCAFACSVPWIRQRRPTPWGKRRPRH